MSFEIGQKYRVNERTLGSCARYIGQLVEVTRLCSNTTMAYCLSSDGDTELYDAEELDVLYEPLDITDYSLIQLQLQRIQNL